jgi:hypothetical protein
MGEIFDHDETMTNSIKRQTPTQKGKWRYKKIGSNVQPKDISQKHKHTPMRVAKKSRGPFKKGTK